MINEREEGEESKINWLCLSLQTININLVSVIKPDTISVTDLC